MSAVGLSIALVVLVYVLTTLLGLAVVGWLVWSFVSFLLRDLSDHLDEQLERIDAETARVKRGQRP